MAQRKSTGGPARMSGPIAGLALAIFTAMTFGVAQSQVAVDAAPWAKAVLDAAKEVILPSPPSPAGMPGAPPEAPKWNFRPGDSNGRLPDAPKEADPKLPEALEPVPLTPYAPLPERYRRGGSADDAQMCAAGCQEAIDAALAVCGGYRSEAALGRRPAPDPQCRLKLKAEYQSCMAGCGFSRLPEAMPGQRKAPADLGPIRSDLAS